MSPLRFPVVTALCAALLGTGMLQAQQADLAAHEDLPDHIPSLFETSGKTQQLLSAESLGLAGGGTLHLSSLSLRHDGPTQSTAVVPHTLLSLTIRIGGTHVSTMQAGSVFADNIGKPLTTVFQQTNHPIPIDSSSSFEAHPWGSANGELTFAFQTPVTVRIPAEGSLLVEFEVVASAGHVSSGTNLDFEAPNYTGHVGTSYPEGLSCGYPSMSPVVLTSGDYDIGTTFRFSGQGFTPNMPVATWLTTLLTPPVILNGSSCWVYLDLNSGPMVGMSFTDANGTFGGDPPVPIPPAPGLCGQKLYLQSAGVTQQSLMNPLGIETSNYRTIVVGCRSPVPARGWYVSQPGSWSAGIATISRPGAMAIRFQ